MSYFARSSSLALALCGSLLACGGFDGDPVLESDLPEPGNFGTPTGSSGSAAPPPASSSGAPSGSSSGNGGGSSSGSTSSSSGWAPAGPRIVREIPSDVSLGEGLAASADTLFFIESGGPDTQLLKSCSFDDCATPRTLGNSPGTLGGLAQLTLDGGKIYYPVLHTQTVRRMNLDGTVDEEVVAPGTACASPRRIAPQVALHDGVLYADYNCTVDGIRTQRIFRRSFVGGAADRLFFIGASSRPAADNTNWVRSFALDSGRLFAWQETASAGAGLGLALGADAPGWSYPAASVSAGNIVATPTQVFFVNDDTGRLAMCPATSACTAPAQLLADRSVQAIARAGTSLYVAAAANDEATVYRCSIDELVAGAGCSTALGTVAAPKGLVRITVSAAGVFLRTSRSRFDAETPARIWQLPL